MSEELILNNGIKMPSVGIGGWAQKKEDILNALRIGYRMIDTAAQYGNEEEIGCAVKESGVRREDVFVTTKIWTQDIRIGRTYAAFEDSLKRLGMDYVDLLLIHWPASGFEDAWVEMENVYKAGKTRAIGVSNFEWHHLEELKLNGATVLPAVNQIESHPYFANQEIIERGKKLGIVAVAWCPLGGPGSGELQDQVIKEIAIKNRKTPAQVILKWHLQRGVVVIPKSSKPERMKENMNIYDFELSESDMSRIALLEQGKRLGAHPDNFDF